MIRIPNPDDALNAAREATVDDIVPDAANKSDAEKVAIYGDVIVDIHYELAKSLYILGVIGGGTTMSDEDWLASKGTIANLMAEVAQYWRGHRGGSGTLQ